MTSENPPTVDPELRAFVQGAFPSVWALETFLALKRNADAPWSVDRLVGELRANTALVSDCLGRLERAGLIVATPSGYQYQPASRGLAALADALQATYAERPFSIISVITSVRPDPLTGFADSFRLGAWKS